MSSKQTLTPFGAGGGAVLRLLSASVGKNQRVREPVKPTTGRVVGYFPSVKNNRSIAWESQLEQKACYVFEFSSEVASYREQPVSVYYQHDGTFKRYTPDFELVLTSGELLYVEIKPVNKLENEELKSQLKSISNFWETQGYAFVVITDKELNQPVLQSNLKLLRSYLRIECDAKLIQISHHWLIQQINPTLADLIAYLDSPKKTFALIAHGHIGINLFEEIKLKCKLNLREENSNETSFFSCRFAPDFE